ncbi:MAG: hypothetical protein RR301_01570 [Clostridia bacterium]
MARFGYSQGHWTFADNNPTMLPQTDKPVRIVNQTEQLAAFALLLGEEANETLQLHFMRTSDGDWRLFYAQSTSPQVTLDTETDGQILYTGYAQDGSGYQTMDIDFPLTFSGFVFDDFPLLPKNAEHI